MSIYVDMIRVSREWSRREKNLEDSLGSVARDDRGATNYNGVLYHPSATASLAGPSHNLPISARVSPLTYPSVYQSSPSRLALFISLRRYPFRHDSSRFAPSTAPKYHIVFRVSYYHLGHGWSLNSSPFWSILIPGCGTLYRLSTAPKTRFFRLGEGNAKSCHALSQASD